jgi:hypothetical protein
VTSGFISVSVSSTFTTSKSVQFTAGGGTAAAH